MRKHARTLPNNKIKNSYSNKKAPSCGCFDDDAKHELARNGEYDKVM
ncbi:MAG: hypothetical protein ACI4R8_00015 [Candidatus Caccovivens sp.]